MSKEDKAVKRAEAINDALYAVKCANQVNQLVTFTPYYFDYDTKRPTRRPELMVLAEAMGVRAADMLLKAFDGRCDGKKLRKAKRAPK